jgi:hypothetical protein
MSKHTPGPWEATIGFVRAKDRGAICKMAHNSPIQYEATMGSIEDNSNALLISAAPELLDALKRIVESYDGIAGTISLDSYLAAERIIAKTEGRE